MRYVYTVIGEALFVGNQERGDGLGENVLFFCNLISVLKVIRGDTTTFAGASL